MSRFSLAATLLLLFQPCSLVAQETKPLPATTVRCDAFKKLPNGNWYAGATTTFDVGNVKSSLTNIAIAPRAFNLGGVDLFMVLERKYGGTPL